MFPIVLGNKGDWSYLATWRGADLSDAHAGSRLCRLLGNERALGAVIQEGPQRGERFGGTCRGVPSLLGRHCWSGS